LGDADQARSAGAPVALAAAAVATIGFGLFPALQSAAGPAESARRSVRRASGSRSRVNGARDASGHVMLRPHAILLDWLRPNVTPVIGLDYSFPRIYRPGSEIATFSIVQELPARRSRNVAADCRFRRGPRGFISAS